jgi:amino acid transporter
MTPRTRTLLIGAIVAGALFATMAAIVSGTQPWQGDSGSDEATARANDSGGLADSLFGPNVIGFEVLGILLTAVMIGALVIARPLDARSDASRYSQPTAAQVEESDDASDVDASRERTAASLEAPQ